MALCQHMSGLQQNGGVPKRHAPGWVQQEAARTQRYSGGQPVRIEEPSDPFETLVPTRNKKALMGYYFAVFSILPLIGLGLGPMAIWQGIRGLGRSRKPRAPRQSARHCRHHPWESHNHRTLVDPDVCALLSAVS